MRDKNRDVLKIGDTVEYWIVNLGRKTEANRMGEVVRIIGNVIHVEPCGFTDEGADTFAIPADIVTKIFPGVSGIVLNFKTRKIGT